MSRTTIETYTGGWFNYALPAAEDVCIEDIARSLSMSVRFRGHVTTFYSVAEHSVRVRQLVREHGRPDLGLGALLHDGHEAYIGDIPTPLKAALGKKLTSLASTVDLAIAAALDFDVRDLHAPEVADADALCLRHEAAVLKRSYGTGEHWGQEWPATRQGFIHGWAPSLAEEHFMTAYRDELEWREDNLG